MKCLFCNKVLPKGRKKYCSKQCIKRAWYLRNNPNCRSYFANNPDFWNTETGIGFKWEEYISNLIGAEHLKFNNGSADLNFNGKKIDVKSCELYSRKNRRGKPVKGKQSGNWIFNRNKNKVIDYFFCVCLRNGVPVKILKIPGNKFPIKGATVGHKSKYDRYTI